MCYNSSYVNLKNDQYNYWGLGEKGDCKPKTLTILILSIHKANGHELRCKCNGEEQGIRNEAGILMKVQQNETAERNKSGDNNDNLNGNCSGRKKIACQFL